MTDHVRSDQGAIVRFAGVVAVLALLSGASALMVTRWYGTPPPSGGQAYLTSGDGAIGNGALTLTDDDQESALFRVGEMLPGHPVAACTKITYQGTVTPASIRLHARSDGELAEFLDVTVDVGTGGRFGDCAGFTPVGTVYSGTLAELSDRHSDWSSGLGTFTASATPTTRTVRFVVELQDDPAAEGAVTSADFTWVTRSVDEDTTVLLDARGDQVAEADRVGDGLEL